MSSSDRPTKFVEEPQALLCPMCGRVFVEPVISIKCGHTFCRGCVEGMIRDCARCPSDGQECDSGQLVLNRAVIGQIDDLKIYCCHGLLSRNRGKTWEHDSNGCKEVLKSFNIWTCVYTCTCTFISTCLPTYIHVYTCVFYGTFMCKAVTIAKLSKSKRFCIS